MSEKKVNQSELNPFLIRKDYEGKKDFDKYYINRDVKEVFRKTGVDESGDEIGIVEYKVIDQKVDIQEFLNSQRDSVGVDAYIRSLGIQGIDINDLSTSVTDEVQDFSKMPDNLADTLLLGDAAKKAFNELDPELKGGHTTIEGFLNSLSDESLQAYYDKRLGISKEKVVDGGDK